MAKNVFISFRFSDGNRYKEYLSGLFDKYSDTIDYFEDVDRSRMSDVTIKQYLYGKLRRSSVTIVLLTPSVVNHKRNWIENFLGLPKSELLYLQEFRSMEHFKLELVAYLDYYNNRRIKAKLKGLPPAIHRQQALSAA